MTETSVSRNRRKNDSSSSTPPTSPDSNPLDTDKPWSDISIYVKEVLNALNDDKLPPTPNNFSLYFDRLLEDKSEDLRKQIVSILELEERNNAENSIKLEQSLKKGFSSIKSILETTVNLYKNMSLMTKILDKRRKELSDSNDSQAKLSIASALDEDIVRLNTIVKKQSLHIKSLYDDTASIVKSVEHETIFDNKFGVYNKRHLLLQIDKEIGPVKEFRHKSSLIIIKLSRDLKNSIANEKSIMLMTRTIAKLLLKTARRSDIVAHYGNGVFAMLLKHTDIESAKKTSERLCSLVSNSNFFLEDSEVHLKISIGIADVDSRYSVEEIVVAAINGAEKADKESDIDYVVEFLTTEPAE